MSLTSTDSQWAGRRIDEILLQAEAVADDALEQISKLVLMAETVRDETASLRAQTEHVLEQLSLESGLDDNGGPATFAGSPINRDAMRADVVSIALNASRAANLFSSLTSIQSALSSASRYFKREMALKTALNASEEGFQASMILVREDERRKLAREIHDGPAQVLTNADYLVQIATQVAKRNPELIEEELTRLRELLKEGSGEVRRFMFNLKPQMLEDYGLGPTIQRIVEQWGRYSGRKATCTMHSPFPKLLPQQELDVFRIVQESLQNAHKYAGNDASVDVAIRLDNGSLVIRIADDGVGFDPALVSPKLNFGAGLLHMRERAENAHATLSIESSPGKGTVITLTLPIDDPDSESGSLVLASA